MAKALNRVAELTEYGGPECIRIVNLPKPTANAGEVRVRVLASSIGKQTSASNPIERASLMAALLSVSGS
jgi:hypothetical protein